MIAVGLNWERCPDGVEAYWPADPALSQQAFSEGWPGLFIRAKSTRRQRFSELMSSLAEPVVFKFVNSVSPAETLAFLNNYGFPGEMDGHPGTAAASMKLHDIQEMQSSLSVALHVKDQPDVQVQTFNDLVVNAFGEFKSPMALILAPRGDGPPAVTIRPTSFFGYMVAEIGLMIAGGAVICFCQHCQRPFLSGKGAKRLGSVYCAPKCGVAAHRARKSAVSQSCRVEEPGIAGIPSKPLKTARNTKRNMKGEAPAGPKLKV